MLQGGGLLRGRDCCWKGYISFASLSSTVGKRYIRERERRSDSYAGLYHSQAPAFVQLTVRMSKDGAGVKQRISRGLIGGSEPDITGSPLKHPDRNDDL